MKPSNFQYGGQAVIEGVMMRGRSRIAIAVRKPDNQIVVNRQPIGSVTDKFKFLKWPFFRGVVALIESMIIGVQALMFSANQATGEDEKLSPLEMTFTMVSAFGLFVLFFIVLPNFLVNFIQDKISSAVAVNLLEGLLRMIIFIAYIGAISRLKEIQRVFEYHGAEHKVIHTYESGQELTVDNARKFTTLHPRCGTSFLLIVMVMSILFFSVLGRQDLLMRIATRLVLLPLLAGASYEMIKFMSRNTAITVVRWMMAPGLALQKLTTREPDDSQLEVAIDALKGVLDSEEIVTLPVA